MPSSVVHLQKALRNGGCRAYCLIFLTLACVQHASEIYIHACMWFEVVPHLTHASWVQGTIPAEWGGNALFPKLVNLSLSYNPPLSGTLPANWGSDNSSLTSLQLFQANNCNLTGPLPANWSMYLPALKDINISSNALSGLCSQPF